MPFEVQLEFVLVSGEGSMKRSRRGELPKRYRCRDKYNKALDIEMSRFTNQVKRDQTSDSESEASTQVEAITQASNTRYGINFAH